MALPFYVSPEQIMKDRAEYARKGIARGRALVALEYADGVLFVGENPSRSLYKTSEIYDRIAFAAVGKYNEFESLRVSGIRLADVKGYQYGREDVTAKSLANAYSQALGTIFMGEGKPYEVEVLIAQVDGHAPGSVPSSSARSGVADSALSSGGSGGVDGPEHAELYHILYDGSIVDEHLYVAVGGQADELLDALKSRYETGLSLEGAVNIGVAVLSSMANREIPPADLEVSGLDRTRVRRKFFRLDDEAITTVVRGT